MLLLLTFTMHPIDEIGSRMGYGITLFLAAVSFQFVIGEDLPKMRYATVLNLYILIVLVLIALVMFLTGAIGYYGHEEWDASIQNASVGSVVIMHMIYTTFIIFRVLPREHAKKTKSTEELNETVLSSATIATTKPGVAGLLVLYQLDAKPRGTTSFDNPLTK